MSSPWREVGDRVWVRRYESLDQTISVIGGDTGLVIIDTQSTHRPADELRADLEQLPGSMAAVVNTQGHWDHAFGNARFVPAPIWGHVRCAAMISERGDEMRIRAQRAYPSEAIDEVELTPPTEVLTDAATLDLGDRQVELRYLGRGHTDNDIVVVVPDASVLFAGDLLEDAPAPAFGDSYPIAWVAAGRALLDLVEDIVVPGHGDPFDMAFAERQVADLAVLAELAKQLASGAIGFDEALRRSPFPAEDSGVAFERARLEWTE